LVAWAVSRQSLLKKLLTDPRVSKSPRLHWRAWQESEVTSDWPLINWVAVQSMVTAYGPDHRRPRTLVSNWPPPRPVSRSICATGTRTPFRSR
jgi:cytochrome P450